MVRVPLLYNVHNLSWVSLWCSLIMQCLQLELGVSVMFPYYTAFTTLVWNLLSVVFDFYRLDYRRGGGGG